MFKLNKPFRVNSGEVVIPFFVEGRLVHVLDKSMNQKIIDLSEFDFNPKKNKKDTSVITVKKQEKTIDEPVFTPNENGYLGGVYEEKKLQEKPPVAIPTSNVVSEEINLTPIELQTLETIPQEVPVINNGSKLSFICANRTVKITLGGKCLSELSLPITKSLMDDFYGQL